MAAKYVKPGLVLGALLALGGCAHLDYHVLPMPGDAWLIPPRVQAVPRESGTFRILFPGIANSAACGFDGDEFSAHAEPNALALTIKQQDTEVATGAVPLQPGVVMIGRQVAASHEAALTALRSGIESMEMAGCFPAAGGDPLVHTLQSVPLASADVSALEIDISGAHGVIALPAGTRLRVTTPLLDEAQAWRDATDLDYDLVLRPSGEIEVRLAAPGAVHVVREGKHLHAQVLPLPPVPVARFWRVIVFGLNNDVHLVNDLVGAPDMASLRAATAQIQQGQGGCALVAAPLVCIAPRYGTVINVELSVWVQGEGIGVRRGSTVAEAIEQRLGNGGGNAHPAGLRVLRPYGGKLIPVVAAPGGHAIYDLVLVGGEHISWKAR